ncbi:MAG: glycosyltransferase family 2 protein [Bacteroidetes bacterium]|nr:glycosyltransferase family 2 protein [Bacteroidota bacterium]
MDFPLVSIISINYDHPEVTCQLLASLRKISYPNIEIIVVDNASPNDDPACIKEQYPEVTLLRSKENLGFAGGNNLGIRLATGKYILLLNNDTEVDPGFLEPMVLKLETNPRIGAVSPKIKYYHTPGTLQFSGITEFNPYTIRNRSLGLGVRDTGQFEEDALTSYCHGAAMMIPIKVIKKVGLMAECYFLYYEEHDFGARIRRAGYQMWYVHNSLVYHKESVSTGKLSPLKTYYMNRSRLIFLRRNISGVTFVIAALYQLLIAMPKNALLFLLRGSFDHFRAYRNAVSWHMTHMFSREIHEQPTF